MFLYLSVFRYDYGVVMFLSCSILVSGQPSLMFAFCEIVYVQQEITKVQL